MIKSGPGEKSVQCSQAPPSAKGTEGYALSITGGLTSVEESGLKGGDAHLPSKGGSEGAINLKQTNAVDHDG